MTQARNKNVIRLSMPVNVNFTAGFLVGLVSGIGFHPADRALYLRLIDKPKHRQHLFAPIYWKRPLTGLRNTVYQRILSHGIYFAMQGELNASLYPALKKDWQWGERSAKACVGMCAGGVSGFVSNASYAVKFYTFTHKPKGAPLANTKEMWRAGGIKPFMNGIHASVLRDASFGVVYELGNQVVDKYMAETSPGNPTKESRVLTDKEYFISRLFTSCLATAISSPLNYARNMQFKTLPQKKQPSIVELWTNVWRESSKLSSVSAKAPSQKAQKPLGAIQFCLQRFKFFQATFMIGAGTVRAAGGMAIGQMLFNKLAASLRGWDESDSLIQKPNT